MMVPTPQCPRCKKDGEVDIPVDEYRALIMGESHIQDAMPTTPAPIREQIMTGIHPACWDAIMSEPER